MASARRWALQDLWAGLLLAAFGVAALVFGADLAMGTARRMGPGYMPYGLAWLLVLIGAAVALRGVIGAGAAVEPMRLRPFLGVLGGGLAFALVIDRGGILLASAGAILGAARPGGGGGPPAPAAGARSRRWSRYRWRSPRSSS